MRFISGKNIKIIRKKLKEKSRKLFYIVHDVESLRLFRDKPEYHHEERSLLNMADGLIVHNQEMRKWLIKDGSNGRYKSI